MKQPGYFTRSEIYSQPRIWAESLARIRAKSIFIDRQLSKHKFDHILFTGCGSTYYLALSLSAFAQELTGVPARASPASEIWLNQASAYSMRHRHLLVAVSRSGQTTETLQAVKSFKESASGRILTLSCYPNSPLAELGDINLIFPEAQEQSIAQTRAFSSLLLAGMALAEIFSGKVQTLSQLESLSSLCSALLDKYSPLAHELGNMEVFDRYYFLGSGARYGLACEASLKMKEMSLSHSEAFHFLEFRHGPMSMVNQHALIVGLLSESNGEQEVALLKEMEQKGASILSIGEKDFQISFDSGLSERITCPLYLPILQLLAYEHALCKGCDPDLPHNLEPVVRLPE